MRSISRTTTPQGCGTRLQYSSLRPAEPREVVAGAPPTRRAAGGRRTSPITRSLSAPGRAQMVTTQPNARAGPTRSRPLPSKEKQSNRSTRTVPSVSDPSRRTWPIPFRCDDGRESLDHDVVPAAAAVPRNARVLQTIFPAMARARPALRYRPAGGREHLFQRLWPADRPEPAVRRHHPVRRAPRSGPRTAQQARADRRGRARRRRARRRGPAPRAWLVPGSATCPTG
jgi:hypothetical protein